MENKMEDYISNTKLPELIGLSQRTIYELRNKGDFFEPVRLSKGRITWRVSDAKAWLASR